MMTAAIFWMLGARLFAKNMWHGFFTPDYAKNCTWPWLALLLDFQSTVKETALLQNEFIHE